MENQKIVFLILFFWSWNICTQAQESVEEQYKLDHKIGLSIFEEHITLPFQDRLGERSHIGFALVYDVSRPKFGAYQFSHQFHLGYFHHQAFFKSAYLSYKPTFSLQFFKTLQINLPIGLGYAISTPTEQTYNLVDGIYEESKAVKHHILPSIGLGATLKLEHIFNIPIELFSYGELFSLAPYASNGSLPFTIHTSINFGLKFNL